jgi:outer membrane autotransporter protein
LRLRTLVVSLSLICIAQDVAAQQRSAGTVALQAGSRVRVKTASLVAPLVANFLEQRGDTLMFIEDGRGRGVWSFAIGQIERLETTAGEASRNTNPMAKGAAIGAGVGLIGGVLFAAAASPSDSTKQYNKILTGLVGAAVGGGVGAYVGSRVKAERWVEVPLHRQLSLRMNTRKLGLTFEFR